jgi:hypothetical protein
MGRNISGDTVGVGGEFQSADAVQTAFEEFLRTRTAINAMPRRGRRKTNLETRVVKARRGL